MLCKWSTLWSQKFHSKRQFLLRALCILARALKTLNISLHKIFRTSSNRVNQAPFIYYSIISYFLFANLKHNNTEILISSFYKGTGRVNYHVWPEVSSLILREIQFTVTMIVRVRESQVSLNQGIAWKQVTALFFSCEREWSWVKNRSRTHTSIKYII